VFQGDFARAAGGSEDVCKLFSDSDWMLAGHSAPQRMCHDMLPEFSVALELVFGKELVGGGFVWEGHVRGAILGYTDWLVACHGSLEVDKVADAAVAVLDLSDGAVGEAVGVLLLADGFDVELDDCPKVGFAGADQIAESPKLQTLIALSRAE
jgi:hypothetical protein